MLVFLRPMQFDGSFLSSQSRAVLGTKREASFTTLTLVGEIAGSRMNWSVPFASSQIDPGTFESNLVRLSSRLIDCHTSEMPILVVSSPKLTKMKTSKS